MFFRSCILAAGFMISAISLASAEAPAIPDAQPLTEAEIKAMLDGKAFAFQAYDMPLSGTSNWDFAGQKVSGDYVYDGQAGTYVAEWTIVDGKSCTKSPDQDRVCQTVYAYENGFMEVNDDGAVHAVSKPQ